MALSFVFGNFEDKQIIPVSSVSSIPIFLSPIPILLRVFSIQFFIVTYMRDKINLI